MKIIFAGTPDFAAAHLQALIDAGHHICAVYTQPDRPAGRGRKLTPSPVKKLAESHNLLINQPLSLKNQEQLSLLRSFEADLMVVVAYGLILPQAVLDTPLLGCINVHASLLPRWRGAAPIQRAIEAGDTETGVTIMQMDAGLDTGDMLFKATTAISNTDTSATLHDKLMHTGCEALTKALTAIEAGTLQPEPQNNANACYAEKLTKAEGAIDWTLPALEIDQKARAFTPWPGTTLGLNDQKIKVQLRRATTDYSANSNEHELSDSPGTILQVTKQGLLIACGDGTVLLEQVQIPGKKMLPVADLLNGQNFQFSTGQQLN